MTICAYSYWIYGFRQVNWCFLVLVFGSRFRPHRVAGRINEIIFIKRLQYQAHNKHSTHVSYDYFSSVADIWPLTEWVLNKWALNKLTIAWMLWENLLSGQFLPLLIFVFLSASPKWGYILNFFLWHHIIVFIIVNCLIIVSNKYVFWSIHFKLFSDKSEDFFPTLTFEEDYLINVIVLYNEQ